MGQKRSGYKIGLEHSLLILVPELVQVLGQVFQNQHCSSTDLKTEGSHISMCSDSQVALRALAVPAIRSWLVGECKKALGRLAERNRLRLLWVPGHTGIRANEIANSLASLGARSRIVGLEPAFVGKMLFKVHISSRSGSRRTTRGDGRRPVDATAQKKTLRVRRKP